MRYTSLIPPRRIISWSVSLASLALVGWYFTTNPESLLHLLLLDEIQIIILIILNSALFIAIGMQFSIAMKIYGKDIDPGESTWLAIAGHLLNYAPAKGGLIARGAYTKIVHDLPLNDYIAATITGRMLQSLTASIAGFAFAIYLHSGWPDNHLLPIAYALAIAGVFFFCALALPHQLINILKYRINAEIISRFLEGITQWWQCRSRVVLYIILSLFSLIITSIRIWLIFNAMGADITIHGAALIQGCVTIGFIFSVTPGNFGVREGLITGIGVLLGTSLDIAILAALVDRVSVTLVAGALGPFAFHSLAHGHSLRQK